MGNTSSAICKACETGDVEQLRKLLADGANPNESDGLTGYHWRPIHYAARYGKHDVIPVLAKAGARLDEPASRGVFSGQHRAINLASKYAHPDCIRALVANGASIDADDQDGWTALMYAIAERNEVICGLLLNLGASPDMFNKKGETSLDLAVDSGRRSLVQVILPRCSAGHISRTLKGLVSDHKSDMVKLFIETGHCSVSDAERYDAQLAAEIAEATRQLEVKNAALREARIAEMGLKARLLELGDHASPAARTAVEEERKAVSERVTLHQNDITALGRKIEAARLTKLQFAGMLEASRRAAAVGGAAAGGGGSGVSSSVGGAGAKPSPAASSGGGGILSAILHAVGLVSDEPASASASASAGASAAGPASGRPGSAASSPAAGAARPSASSSSSSSSSSSCTAASAPPADTARRITPAASAPAPAPVSAGGGSRASPAAGAKTPTPTASAPSNDPTEDASQSGLGAECSVCMSAPKNTVLLDCWHTLCEDCAKAMVQKPCPYCRAIVKSVRKPFI